MCVCVYVCLQTDEYETEISELKKRLSETEELVQRERQLSVETKTEQKTQIAEFLEWALSEDNQQAWSIEIKDIMNAHPIVINFKNRRQQHRDRGIKKKQMSQKEMCVCVCLLYALCIHI